MALWEKLKGELVDIIEWTDDSQETMVYRFERYGNEIKYAAKLTVREGQAAVFVNEGKIADVFGPGMYRLETQNMPILTTLKGWAYGFESPFKAEVYFVKTTRFTDRKWGTKNPIIMRDQDFGAVRVRAFGNYAMRVTDPGKFLQEIVGTDGDFTADEITDQLRNLIVSRFSDKVAESRIPVLDLAANYDEIGDLVGQRIAPEFADYGITLTKLLVENISVPPAVEEALDKRASMGAVGDLNKYAQFQAANAMEAAANNPAGGGAAEGMGLGMGFGMAQQFANQFAQPQAAQQQPQFAAAMPPPPPQAVMFHLAVGGQTTGPFTLEQLQQQAVSGQFKPDSLVWKAGMSGWEKAAGQAELAAVFRQSPPPPPPPAS